MRVLFVPLFKGEVGHGITLLALARQCRACDPSIETAFLLTRARHAACRRLGFEVLDIDHQGRLWTELRAYRQFAPDLIVDDYSLTTRYASTIVGAPRVALVRTGGFPGTTGSNPAHPHSIPVDFAHLPDASGLDVPPPRTIFDLLEAEHYVVPSVPSVEPLPDTHREDPRFTYAGPLLLPDTWLQHWVSDSEYTSAERARLEAFYDRHASRPVVFITLGTVVPVAEQLSAGIRLLMDRGIAIVSTVPIGNVHGSASELCYIARYVPVDYACRRSAAVVHHGGGTYLYPLVHGVPAVTLGTLCWDRVDVGLRLEQLGLARYVPHPTEVSDFPSRFADLVCGSLDRAEDPAFRERAVAMREEIGRTTRAFRVVDVLQDALGLHRRAATSPRESPLAMDPGR